MKAPNRLFLITGITFVAIWTILALTYGNGTLILPPVVTKLAIILTFVLCPLAQVMERNTHKNTCQ